MGPRTEKSLHPAYQCLFASFLYLSWYNGVAGQTLQEQEGVCDADGCYSLHLQRKSFRESWRSCRDKGGNLATIRRPEEATLVHKLLSTGVKPGSRPRIRLWIGLQRQPRQCSSTRPLRGFTWISGDQETQYTNWQRDDLPNACTAHRCVVISYNTADKSGSDHNNFKWLDGSCTVAVDGHLCHYTFQGMCPSLLNEGGGPAVYTTPFELASSLLTHIPFGSVAILPCPDAEKERQSVLCTLKDDGTVGWSADAPLCQDSSKDWCGPDNGGCEHSCSNTDTYYYCECFESYILQEDGKTCQYSDPCHAANCEFECEVTLQGHLCKCPDGFLLSSDGQNCLDADECLQNPCPHVCVNAPGTFECRCNEGYALTEFGQCEDVDECVEGNCVHLCKNLPGSYSCGCHEGFAPLADDPDQCEDIDECLTEDTCHHKCRNYEGGFECLCDDGYILQDDNFYCLRSDDDPSVVSETVLEEHTEFLSTSLNLFTGNLQDIEKATQEPGLFRQASSNSHSSHISDATTSATYYEYPNEEELSNADTSNIRTPGDNGPAMAPSAAPRSKWDVVMNPPASQMPDVPLRSGTEASPSERKKNDKSWLLVALLVPLCVFIVVMLALGIVYCTSCAVESRNKGVTDCYRWTTTSNSNNSDKAKSRA